MKVLIRKFRKKDAKSVSKLDKKYSKKNYYKPKDLIKLSRKKLSTILVTEHNEKLVGFLIGWRIKERGSLQGNIEMLFVEKRFRRKGVGTKLIKEFIKILKGKKVKILLLISPLKDKNALKLYKKSGFKISAYHLRKKI